jgi:hypothetical protein
VFSIPKPWQGDRKHTISWIKIISHYETWEILFITYLPPHICFCWLYSSEVSHWYIGKYVINICICEGLWCLLPALSYCQKINKCPAFTLSLKDMSDLKRYEPDATAVNLYGASCKCFHQAKVLLESFHNPSDEVQS